MEMGSPDPALELNIDFLLSLMKGEKTLSVYDMNARQQATYIQFVVSTLRPEFHWVNAFRQLGRVEVRNHEGEGHEYEEGVCSNTKCICLESFDVVRQEIRGSEVDLHRYLYLSRCGNLVLRQTFIPLHRGGYERIRHSFQMVSWEWLEEQLSTELDAGVIVQSLVDLIIEDSKRQEDRLAQRRKILDRFTVRATGLIKV
jgi:hypothetical protein